MLIITLPSTTWERAKYNNSPKLNRDTLKEMKNVSVFDGGERKI